MKPAKTWTLAAMAATGLVCASAAGAQNMTLDQVYEQMDKAATAFRSVEAQVLVDRYTAIVQEHSTQSGTYALRRTAGGAMEMAMHLGPGSDDPETFILYQNGKADVYQPAQKTETEVSAGANRGEFDSILTTGFGASSKDLQANWDVSFRGMQSVGGNPCAELDLVSKQQNVRNNFSQVNICVDPARDISLQVVMVQPDSDTRTATYTKILYNTKLNDNTFRLDVPKGVQKTYR